MIDNPRLAALVRNGARSIDGNAGGMSGVHENLKEGIYKAILEDREKQIKAGVTRYSWSRHYTAQASGSATVKIPFEQKSYKKELYEKTNTRWVTQRHKSKPIYYIGCLPLGWKLEPYDDPPQTEFPLDKVEWLFDRGPEKATTICNGVPCLIFRVPASEVAEFLLQ